MGINAELHADIWRRIHDAIDRREDPLADDSLAEELSCHPELAAQVLQLLADLEHLPASSSQLPAAKLASPVAGTYVAAAALVIGAAFVWQSVPNQEHRVTPAPTPVVAKALAYRQGAPHFEMVVERSTSSGRRRFVQTNERSTSEYQPSTQPAWLDALSPSTDSQRLSAGDHLSYQRITTLSRWK